MNTKHLLFVCPILLTLACNQKKQFSSPVESKTLPAQEAPAIKDTDNIPQGSGKPETTIPAEPAPKCEVGEAEVTTAKILTDGVDFSKQNQLVKYELQLLSCKDGTAVPFNDQAILFDLNMHYYNGDLAPIAYRVLEASSNAELVAGDFETINGSDLFGNSGGGFRHWKTEDVSFKAKVEKVILEIDLKQAKLRTVKTGDKTADSYLRIGKALPVTAVITVLGQ